MALTTEMANRKIEAYNHLAQGFVALARITSDEFYDQFDTHYMTRVPADRQGSQLLFRIIGDSYERNSLVVTTNLEFSKWGSIFTDEQMVAAMIDRLVHHGHLLVFEGQSYRLTHALMRKGMTKMMEGQDVVN